MEDGMSLPTLAGSFRGNVHGKVLESTVYYGFWDLKTGGGPI